MNRCPERYYLFLHWLTFAGALVFCLWLAWHYGVSREIFERDPTYVSFLIALMFLAGTAHCGVRAFYLSRQTNIICHVIRLAEKTDSQPLRLVGNRLMLRDRVLDASLAGDYLGSILLRYGGGPSISFEPQLEHAQLTDILAQDARGPHEIGWFVTGLLLKLGLLGTVIGFVMMVSSVSAMESLDISNVQQVLSDMTVGMGVALNTTLVGLTASMLLGFQYILLDRGADGFISQTVHFAQTVLVPGMNARG